MPSPFRLEDNPEVCLYDTVDSRLVLVEWSFILIGFHPLDGLELNMHICHWLSIIFSISVVID